MPYEIAFTKLFEAPKPDGYWNDCCWGGDVVCDQLLPMVQAEYEDIQSNQEDWGWFIWFSKNGIALAIDVFCDDSATGVFRVHLTSRQERWFMPDHVVDTEELEQLKDLVVRHLEAWVGSRCTVVRLDGDHKPLEDESAGDLGY